MGWYTCVKKINGHRYLYRQRTWREQGKVKCESIYLGPVNGSERGAGVPKTISTNENVILIRRKPEAPLRGGVIPVQGAETTGFMPITDKTEKPPPEIPKPTFRYQRYLKAREDLSEWSLEREHHRVEARMRASGVDPQKLRAIRLWKGREVKRRKSLFGYFVTIPMKGHKIAFRRAVREAHASRWLDGLQKQNKALYRELKRRSKKGKRYWRTEQIKFLGQAIGNGYPKVLKKYKQADQKWTAILTAYRKQYKQMGILDRLTGKKAKQRKKVIWALEKAKDARADHERVAALGMLFE